MKKSINKLVVVMAMLFVSNFLIAQTAVGVRFGGLTNGLTVKHYTKPSKAIEGILSVGRKSFVLTGLWEHHSGIENSSGIKFLYGIGGHVGFFQDGGGYYYNGGKIYTSTTVLGIDGIIGLDYKFPKAPINITLDLKPFIDFFNGTVIYFDGGLSVRYVF